MHSIMKLLNLLLCVLTYIIAVYGDGEVAFISSPPSVEFRGHEKLDLSVVKDVFSAALGFSTVQSVDWRGMEIKDPFNYAEAVVGVAIPGVTSLDTNTQHIFPLTTDAMLDDVFGGVETSMLERYPLQENQKLVHVLLDEGPLEAEVNLGKGQLKLKPVTGNVHLKDSVEEHKAFLSQLSLLNAIVDKIEEVGIDDDGIQDAYWFVLPALHTLIDVEGEESKAVFEAKRLLSSAITRLAQVFETTYQGKVLVAQLTSDVKHTRRFRRQSDTLANTTYNWNTATVYSADYAPTFNIILWLVIAFVMAIIAISMATAGMDPGDSIIYRMTSNRMKKDS